MCACGVGGGVRVCACTMRDCFITLSLRGNENARDKTKNRIVKEMICSERQAVRVVVEK